MTGNDVVQENAKLIHVEYPVLGIQVLLLILVSIAFKSFSTSAAFIAAWLWLFYIPVWPLFAGKERNIIERLLLQNFTGLFLTGSVLVIVNQLFQPFTRMAFLFLPFLVFVVLLVARIGPKKIINHGRDIVKHR